jgi:hypothetical protein
MQKARSPCIIPVFYAPGSFPYLGDSYEQVDGLSHPHANPHMFVSAAASSSRVLDESKVMLDLLKSATIAFCNLDASIDAR